MMHALPILFSLIWSFRLYFAKTTSSTFITLFYKRDLTVYAGKAVAIVWWFTDVETEILRRQGSSVIQKTWSCIYDGYVWGNRSRDTAQHESDMGMISVGFFNEFEWASLGRKENVQASSKCTVFLNFSSFISNYIPNLIILNSRLSQQWGMR
jgi:hypothetical protein